ncbi:uncharacterized protein LOC117221546 isoform X3 [Megalopta genalis]|uniref:uncharacterized protein LOC117221546 isoform X3 n=1 Tax=Megalopta genalis TaxID=115081 RepID=UPI003FD673A4
MIRSLMLLFFAESRHFHRSLKRELEEQDQVTTSFMRQLICLINQKCIENSCNPEDSLPQTILQKGRLLEKQAQEQVG